MQLQPHQQRVVDEKTELDEKIEKLLAFISSENKIYMGLKQGEKNRLSRQLRIMYEYSETLLERIEAFK